MKNKHIIYDHDTCVCCGAIVPEGRMVCDSCKEKVGLNDLADNGTECTPTPPKQKEKNKKPEDK